MIHCPAASLFCPVRAAICYKARVTILSPARALLPALALFILPAMARANIGDDLTALRGRYGSAKDMGGEMLFEVRLTNGQIVPARGSVDTASHFSVAVYFDGVHSAMEVFTRDTSDPAKANMTQKDIDTILAAESDGQQWYPIEVPTGRTTWSRADKKIIARFDPNRTGKPDDASVLVIMSAEK
jgi:hypothetical protein